jgi:hypothetical protein
MTAATRGIDHDVVKRPIGALELGGALSALGALCVVATTIFYVLSPAAVAGPVHPLDLTKAISGAASGAGTLHAAGMVGVFGDLVWATAALLISGEMGRRSRALSSAGWICLLFSIALFTLVDGVTGFVLPQLAASANRAAFEGFKRFWDMLFLLGVGAYAAGAITLVSADIASDRPMIGRGLALASIIVACIAGLAALAGFAGVSSLPADKIAGGCIGLGSAIFIPVSLQIARAGRANA